MINKSNKPLIETNPYLRDPKERHHQFVMSVVTSTAMEGVVVTPSQLRKPSKRTAKRK